MSYLADTRKQNGYIYKSGVHEWNNGVSVNGNIPIEGLQPDDIVTCNLVSRSSLERLILSTNDHANSRINILLSATGLNSSTKISYVVIRP